MGRAAEEMLEGLAPGDRRRVAGALVALAASLIEIDVENDVQSVDLVREGHRRGLWPSVDVGAAHCRAGRVLGAVKVGRRWVGPATSLDAFVRDHGAAPTPTVRKPPTAKVEPVDEMLEAARAAARRTRRQ